MKTFARVAIIIIYVIEALCALGALIGLLFKSMQLAGANELIMLSFFIFGCVYFIVAMIPYYKKLISDNPVFKQIPSLIVRRLLYVSLGWLSFADLFFLLKFDGRESLGWIVLVTVIVLTVAAVLLIFLDKERRHVFQWVLFRLALFLILFFKVATFS